MFVEDVDVPVLAEADDHHLRRVLRLRDGASLTVADGRGSWRACRLGSRLEPTSEVHLVDPPPPLGVGFAVTKAQKPELVVQKLTELGLARILPFFSARSVVRWDDARRTKHQERLARVALEAAAQSRRVWLPDLAPISTYAQVSRYSGVVRADLGGGPLDARWRTVLVGPEGGWADEERAEGPSVSLGTTVLRAETAAIAAGVLLMDRWR